LSAAIAGLEPKPIWDHFARISEIPRPSKNEGKISAHVIELARKHDLEVKQDDTGNVVVRKPASSGKADSQTVAVQSHLDMVCEKNRDVKHDFDREGIELVRADGYVKASGTTLGSDNGIGVAAALSIMLDNSLVHGPLEFLFTVDEETGLTGASSLTPGFLKSKILLNLDSEEEGALYVGCSGGRDTLLSLPVEREVAPKGFVPVGLTVAGLRGGHSGLDIHAGRGNALKLLVRALWQIATSIDIRVSHLEGGSKRNAIPREAEAVIYAKEQQLEALRDRVREINSVLKNECSTVEPNLLLKVTESNPATNRGPLKKTDQDRLLSLLYGLPHGVVVMSADIPGLVETSTNLAMVQMDQESVTVGTSHRSSVNSALENIATTVGVIGGLAGAKAEHTDGYPGWKSNLNSTALKVTKQTYAQLFGEEPEIKAIHAGLECGIIGQKFPGMDMVSFGPTIEGAHSPDERVEIATVQKFWDLLTGVLKNLA
jgi:dipeptidase D